MRMPFQRLMELCEQIDHGDQVSLGELSERWGEPAMRIADAIDAVRVCKGEQTYFPVG